jgi:Zn-dependent M28 family amino/carboxypeptidase
MMSTELGETRQYREQVVSELTFDTRYDDPADPNRFFYRSDHFNYARKGIPIIFFFDGVHETIIVRATRRTRSITRRCRRSRGRFT